MQASLLFPHKKYGVYESREDAAIGGGKLASKLLIRLSFIYIPCILLFTNHYRLIKGKLLFDSIWLLLGTVLFLLFCMRWRLREKKYSCMLFAMLLGLLSLSIFKYLNFGDFLGISRHFNFFIFMVEYKLLVYMAVAMMILIMWGAPRMRDFEEGAKWLATLMIIDTAVRWVLYKHLSRPNIIDEANYDCYLILMGLIAHNMRCGFRIDRYVTLISIATFASMSKMGIICLATICLLQLRLKNTISVSITVVVLFFAGFFVFSTRLQMSGVESLKDIDRYYMYESFLELQETANIFQKTIGYRPGYPLSYNNYKLGWFVNHEVVEKFKGTGLHGFVFHGMWPRLICTWGWLIPVALLLALLYWSAGSKVRLSLAALIILQGTVMGVFYLSGIGVFQILFIASLGHVTHRGEKSVLRSLYDRTVNSPGMPPTCLGSR